MRKGLQRDVAAPRPIVPPAKTPEERENQLSAYAYDLAERQMLDGTASAQVITHFLKASSSREKLEQQRIRHENELLVVKREQIASGVRIEELYKDAVAAMRGYSGQALPAGNDDEDGYDD